jgi:hypothetical protein
MINQIQAGAGRNGSRALYGDIRQSGCCGTDPQKSSVTQNPYLLLPASEVRELYISYWVKLQPDLAQKLHAGRPWRVLFEWKSAGDFRVILSVVAHARVAPFWQIGADNVANGGLPHEEYWRVDNRSVPVPVGRWFKLEVFWHRSSGAAGRVWMAIDGQVIVDRSGPLMGVNNAPINRIMVTQIYSGGAYPIYQWVDDLQIWSRFPTAAPGDPWYDPPYAPH